MEVSDEEFFSVIELIIGFLWIIVIILSHDTRGNLMVIDSLSCVPGDKQYSIYGIKVDDFFNGYSMHLSEDILQVLDIIQNIVRAIKSGFKRRELYRILLVVHIFLVMDLRFVSSAPTETDAGPALRYLSHWPRAPPAEAAHAGRSRAKRTGPSAPRAPRGRARRAAPGGP